MVHSREISESERLSRRASAIIAKILIGIFVLAIPASLAAWWGTHLPSWVCVASLSAVAAAAWACMGERSWRPLVWLIGPIAIGGAFWAWLTLGRDDFGRSSQPLAMLMSVMAALAAGAALCGWGVGRLIADDVPTVESDEALATEKETLARLMREHPESTAGDLDRMMRESQKRRG